MRALVACKAPLKKHIYLHSPACTVLYQVLQYLVQVFEAPHIRLLDFHLLDPAALGVYRGAMLVARV